MQEKNEPKPVVPPIEPNEESVKRESHEGETDTHDETPPPGGPGVGVSAQ